MLEAEYVDWWGSLCLVITLVARMPKRIRSEAVSALVQKLNSALPATLNTRKHNGLHFADLNVVIFNNINGRSALRTMLSLRTDTVDTK